MILLPYKELKIETSLSKREFSEKILNVEEAGASGYYWFRRSGFYFSGQANEKGFDLIKTVPYWNLSPVKLKGKFIYDDLPLVIKLKVYNPFARPVFIITVLVCTGLIFNYRPEVPWGILVLIFFISWVIINLPYQIEAPKAIKTLIKTTGSSLIG